MSGILRFLALVPLVFCLGSATSHAQNYPSKPVRVIVPAASGTNPDVLARLIFQQMSEGLRQQFIIDNRPGTGGTIAAAAAAKLPADGYSLFMGDSGPISIWPALSSKLSYDSARDFVPIAGLVRAPLILLVHPSIQVNSVGDLVAYAKSRPEKLRYGTFGNGSVHHLITEMFTTMAGIKMVHVPFRAGSEFLGGLLNGDIEVAFFGAPLALPHIKDGKLRVLGITSGKRSPALPSIPAIAELGFPRFDVSASIGLLAPTGTPREVIATLQAAAQSAMADAKIRDRVSDLGMMPIPANEAYEGIIRSETEMFGQAVRAAGVKID